MPSGSPMRWLDSSGNGRDVFQADPGSMPQRLAGGFNFANSGYFSGPPPLSRKAMNFTMAVAFNAAAVSTHQVLLSQGRADFASARTAVNFYLATSNLRLDWTFGWQQYDTQLISTGKINFAVIAVAAGTGGSTGAANGANDASSAWPDGTLDVSDACFNIARQCPSRANGDVFRGAIHEVMVFSSTLPSDARRWIEGYFAWKWGLVANLPSSHMYSATPPA